MGLGDAKETACIEIVLHAKADPAVLEDMLKVLARSARLPRGQLPQLQAITHMRLVIDPINSVAYRRDMQRYSYWANGAAAPNHALTESEKISTVSGSLTAAESGRH